ncbi:MAG TPA: biopolymer transporter ExbD [Verrucomicrobiae bacterium]|nr:biopolymer transporter ExbD [Verrucomicrobiae bacterium]
MKFPRNARIFRGQLDAAPFVTVFFLLVLFVILGRHLYAPGVQLELPSTGDLDLPGTDQPTIPVAVTTNAIYYDNQLVSETQFSNQLAAARQKIPQPVTLVVEADREVSYDRLVRLAIIARGAGIYNCQLATKPRVFDSPDAPAQHP